MILNFGFSSIAAVLRMQKITIEEKIFNLENSKFKILSLPLYRIIHNRLCIVIADSMGDI